MEKFTSYEWISACIMCLAACLLRLGGEVNKLRESKNPKYRITLWKVIYNVSAAVAAGFLALNWMRDWDLGPGKKMFVMFLSSFLAPTAVDALMLVTPRMLLNEFAKWLSSKTGTPTPDATPSNETQDEADDTTPAE